MAPFRSIDEFLTSESKFEMPELNNPEKMSHKVVSNLLYYQTNYFVSFAAIFLAVFFFVPWKMIYIMILLAMVFGAQHYMSLHHVHVKVWKKNHPTAVMSATFVIGMFFLYQVTPNSPHNPTVQRPSAFPLCGLAGSPSSSGASSSLCCSQPSTPSSTSRGRLWL